MSDENRSIKYDDDHRSHHPFAFGVLAGAAVGVGVGMLLAPTKGTDARKHVGKQLTQLKGVCATGFDRVKSTAGDWAHKSRGAYDTGRDFVARHARETGRYMRDVADAVTMKSSRASERASQSETGFTAESGFTRRPPLTVHGG